MVHKLTTVRAQDHSGARWVLTFHTYTRWWRGVAYQGEYIKGTVRALAFLPCPIRGRRYRPLRVGHKVRGMLTCGHLLRGVQGSVYPCAVSPGLLIVKKRATPRTPYVSGPLCRPRSSRQFYSLYPSMV